MSFEFCFMKKRDIVNIGGVNSKLREQATKCPLPGRNESNRANS